MGSAPRYMVYIYMVGETYHQTSIYKLFHMSNIIVGTGRYKISTSRSICKLHDYKVRRKNEMGRQDGTRRTRQGGDI